MNRQQWIDKALSEKVKLEILIRKYHPVYTRKKSQQEMDLVGEGITAPNEERACEVVREQIRGQFDQEQLGDPIQIFGKALENGQAMIAFRIVDQTWFGVPETRACWIFTGFREAVDLLDDPPDQEDGGDLVNGDAERDEGSHGINGVMGATQGNI